MCSGFFMLRFIKSFLIFIILYHILVTVLCYGIFGGQYQEIFSIVRDGIWFVGIVVIALGYRKSLWEYLKVWKYPLIGFWILLIFGIGMSLFHQKEWYDIFVWIKYGFWYLTILLSSSLIGFLLAKYKQSPSLQKFLRYVVYGSIFIVVAWFLWQFAKTQFPDFFTWIGYGPLDDFRFGDRPPLYYLTWYEGILRWQGIFAGPNNYGYFLVAFLPIIIFSFKSRIISLKLFFKDTCAMTNAAIVAIWVAAIVMTLSRSAVVWSLVVVLFLFRSWIKKHRKIALWWLVLCILWLVWLSFLKDTSTLAHIAAKFNSLGYVINQPLGYGLWSSGPAIHHNGNILPENYFIQIMVDIGTVGFLIWIFCVSQVAMITRLIKNEKWIMENNYTIYMIWRGLTIWWIALLVMGMFLHVFEDSMVNYIFFILWGITTWFLSYSLKGVRWWILDFWRRR